MPPAQTSAPSPDTGPAPPHCDTPETPADPNTAKPGIFSGQTRTLGGVVLVAVLLLLAGGALLVFEQGLAGQVQLLGLLAVALATAAWGVDNTLSRGVADRDPGQVVWAKALLGSVATGVLALASREALPGWTNALALLAVGATGYGLSLRFYLLAQRTFGAARTGSVFAFAPFVGAAGAFALGERSGSVLMAVGGGLMALGVLLHLMERHSHAHTHEALEHEHAHSHAHGDDHHHDSGEDHGSFEMTKQGKAFHWFFCKPMGFL